MTLFLPGMAVLLASGLAALLASRSAKACTILGAGGAVAGCALGLVPAAQGLCGPALSIRIPWSLPGGSFYLGIDPLSAFFLIPILGLSLVSAVYGGQYMMAYAGKKSLGVSWFSYNLLIAGMAMAVVAKNALLFLAAWEVMALASFFLVTFESEKPEAREAGWIYLVATHIGTAFLLVFFLLGGGESLDFDKFSVGGQAGLLFILAVVGFGTKAGFMPLHVWLPEAHPAAPSHVSAVMSGVMIKTGIYGLLRALTLLGAPQDWWGWVLVVIGLSSGVLGVLFALAQHDLKRLLAYHSVENIGIIALGLGAGLLGVSTHSPVLAVLGFGGGLLHVVNHALFKGLLFLGAGAVAQGTGTREIDRLGGLLKRMPWTGVTFLVGAAAISGLPPFNGFISEFLIYLGAFGAIQGMPAAGILGITVIGAPGLIGGLAAACFAKAFGIVFLGEPREKDAASAREAGWFMRLPMAFLAAACLGIGLAGGFLLKFMGPVIGQVSGYSTALIAGQMSSPSVLLQLVAGGMAVLLFLTLALAWMRKALLRGREVTSAVTWDCGYARPSASMQYTASSFAQPLVRLFGFLLRVRRHSTPPGGLFPQAASLETHAADPAHQEMYLPFFLWAGRAANRLRVIQHGRLNLYLLNVVLTLAALLLWEFLWAS